MSAYPLQPFSSKFYELPDHQVSASVTDSNGDGFSDHFDIKVNGVNAHPWELIGEAAGKDKTWSTATFELFDNAAGKHVLLGRYLLNEKNSLVPIGDSPVSARYGYDSMALPDGSVINVFGEGALPGSSRESISVLFLKNDEPGMDGAVMEFISENSSRFGARGPIPEATVFEFKNGDVIDGASFVPPSEPKESDLVSFVASQVSPERTS